VASGLNRSPPMKAKDPAELLGGRLLMGSASVSVADFGVTHAINCAAEVANLHPKTLRLEWREVAGETLENVRPAVLAFWDAAMKRSDAVVFVHCAAGRSRSVAVSIMILHLREHMSLRRAFQAIFEQRGVIEPNADLWRQLVELTGSPPHTTQDACKTPAMLAAAVVPRPLSFSSSSPGLVASNVDELRQVFAECAAVRKKAFHVNYTGRHVTSDLTEVLLKGKPGCVTIVTLSAECVYDDPALQAALKRKLHFVFS
jgi:protein-tyrosine phosphatase